MSAVFGPTSLLLRELAGQRAEELSHAHPDGTLCRFFGRCGSGVGRVRGRFFVTSGGRVAVFVNSQPGYLYAEDVAPFERTWEI